MSGNVKDIQGPQCRRRLCTAEALVSHGGFNTLASFQMAMMFGDKQVKCGDQNNPDLYKKPMKGKALACRRPLAHHGGMVLYHGQRHR